MLVTLLGVNIFSIELDEAFQEVIRHIPEKKGVFFCLCNLHLVMECQKKPELREVLNKSAANFPDGKGLVMGLRILGCKLRFKVRGTDLMLRLCSYASENNLRIFLYGNSEKNLASLVEKLNELYPNICIAGKISPPFRKLTEEEDTAFVQEINACDPDILFVSLGAPKQEKWMAEHVGKIRATQLGVGAAFEFITGEIKQAPLWMQKTPLEWVHRLPQQPRKGIPRMLLIPGFFLRCLVQLMESGRIHSCK